MAGGRPCQFSPYWDGLGEARNFKFLRNKLNKEINQRNFKDPLKIPRVKSFVKLQRNGTNVFEGAPPSYGVPLTESRPIGED